MPTADLAQRDPKVPPLEDPRRRTCQKMAKPPAGPRSGLLARPAAWCRWEPAPAGGETERGDRVAPAGTSVCCRARDTTHGHQTRTISGGASMA
jgi:hypothetical protein